MAAKPTNTTPAGGAQEWLFQWWVPVNVVLGGMILLFVVVSALATDRMVDAGEAADVANLFGMAARFVLTALLIFNIVMALIWAVARMNRNG